MTTPNGLVGPVNEPSKAASAIRRNADPSWPGTLVLGEFRHGSARTSAAPNPTSRMKSVRVRDLRLDWWPESRPRTGDAVRRDLGRLLCSAGPVHSPRDMTEPQTEL